MSRNLVTAITLAVAASCTAVLLVLGDRLIFLRIVLGIPFLLLLPGHAAMLYVDPEGRISGFEWLTLTIAVSVSVTALVSIALAASVGLTADGVVLAIAGVSALLLAAAATRGGTAAAQRPVPLRLDAMRRAGWATVTLLACAGLILWISLPRSSASSSANVVELWGLRGASGSVRIGATNVDANVQRFHLAISQSGRTISEQQIELPAGSSRVFVVNASAMLETTAPVDAVLEDPSATLMPRSVSVWPQP